MSNLARQPGVGGRPELHLDYRLEAPAEADAASLLRDLRERLVGGEIAAAGELWDLPEEPRTGYGAEVVRVEGDGSESTYELEVEPLAGFCFLAWPCVGCEALALGLARYPAAAFDPVGPRPRPTGLGEGWHWSGGCFTGAALFRGVLEFMACHAGACAVLETVRAAGIGLSVKDATGFWWSREPARLLGAAAASLDLEASERLVLSTALARAGVEGAPLPELARLLRAAAGAASGS